MENRSEVAGPLVPAPTPSFPHFDLSQWGFSASDLGLQSWDLARYDLPSVMVQPLLRAFRHTNTAADALFYDVGLLWLRLYTRGVMLSIKMPSAAAQNSVETLKAASNLIDLSAFANPEGIILVIDAHRAPFVRQYHDVTTFLAALDGGSKSPSVEESQLLHTSPGEIDTITVSGVGSSALGSAAFGWNVSEALRKPVAAIVPGYGLADLLPQALSGWFGFGVHDFIRRVIQNALVSTAPQIAAVGHHLATTSPNAASRQRARSPDAAARPEDKAVFRSGSPESDILHDILASTPRIKRLYGHSKGALCIQNAIRSLPSGRYVDLHVTTFGCVIQEETDADYHQVLGRNDGLGQLNSWGNWPEEWIGGWHSTNSMLPLTMPVTDLVTKDVRDEDPVKVDRHQLGEAIEVALRKLLPSHMLAPAGRPS
jgi:hypothetical protein